MARTPRAGPLHLASIALDPEAGEPLHRQLYFALREAILEGRLRPAARLPSSRALAADLGVSRNTVLAAFEQLLAEGYIEGRVGAGSYVSQLLPEDALNARAAVVAGTGVSRPPPGPSRRGVRLAATVGSTIRPRAFAPGLPELAQFPFEEWARLLQRHWRAPPSRFLIGGDPAGHAPLRAALAAHLGAARAVRCAPEQVFVVSGAQQALDLATRVLLDPGDAVWVEDPGYPGLLGVLAAAGVTIVPVGVDGEGLMVAEGRTIGRRARMACVSPSHQFPLGVTMSLARRLELLDWAREADAFVLEDDYDSEYRYAGRPLAALQGLDADGRVLYVGTMSKVMFPGLRLGYMVVPPHLVDAFLAVRRATDTHPSTLAQPALAEFIEDGSLSAHIRRTRALYARRQELLLESAARHLDGRLHLAPSAAGMHLVGRLAEGVDDRALARRARHHEVEAPAMSGYYHGHAPSPGLLLGYAGVPDREIERAVERLAKAFADRIVD
ncbi:MAG: PLP-dependent aminotransferase family protein [Geminicoccaceae bacterium]|nr:PLP-dependent aminotransferase family protein [Geminicoccaceae bacterium]